MARRIRAAGLRPRERPSDHVAVVAPALEALLRQRMEPGAVHGGKYKVIRTLGRGGMGVVLEVEHTLLRERLALKFLLPDVAAHPEMTERFLREARAAIRIKSEHVAKVMDVATLEDGTPFMVMELLEGNDLEDRLRSRGALEPAEAVGFIIEACDAIADAHAAGIVHRDIKPSNLFVARRSDGSELVKVLDFGIAKLRDDDQLTLTRPDAAMGSAMYMSPEQLQEARAVDGRADIYALGVTLYRLLSGTYPYEAGNHMELCAAILTGSSVPIGERRSGIAPGLADAVARAHAADREQRFATVGELAQALAPHAPPSVLPIVERIARVVAKARTTVESEPIPNVTVRKIRRPRGGGPAPGAEGDGTPVTAGDDAPPRTDLGHTFDTTLPKRSPWLAVSLAAGATGVVVAAIFMTLRGPPPAPAPATPSGAAASGVEDRPAAVPEQAPPRGVEPAGAVTESPVAPPPPSASARPRAGAPPRPIGAPRPSAGSPDNIFDTR